MSTDAPATPPPDAPLRRLRRRRPSTLVLVIVGLCLVGPFVALLWVSSYAHSSPELWGLPFFYWYQFLWVFLAAVLTYAAHRLLLGRGHGRTDGDAR